MSNGSDKRMAFRVPHEAKIRYCTGGQDDYRPARMYNHSATGMYLELKYPPPKLGAQLLIEVLEPPQGKAQWSPEEAPDAKTCYYATVIWKKNLDGSSNAEYGIGLRYLHPPLED